MGKMGNPRCAVVGGGLDHVVNRKMYHTHGVPNTLSLRREKFPRMLCAHCGPEPTPSPSQEGSSTDWPVPLLGGVRGGLVGARFMGRGALNRLRSLLRSVSRDFPFPHSFVCLPRHFVLRRRQVAGRDFPECCARIVALNPPP